MKSLQKSIDTVLSVLYQMGWKQTDFTGIQTLSLRAGTAKREFFLIYALLKDKSLISFVLPQSFSLPSFETLYSRYLDFNFDIYLLLKYFEEKSPETQYLLYFDDYKAYFYDIISQECLIHCSDVEERSDRLFPHLDKRKVESGSLEKLVRKPTEQLAKELNGWLHIWSAELGSRTQTRRKTLERFIRKLILAQYYSILFGPENPAILFEGFVTDPEHIKALRRTVSPLKFLKGLFEYFQNCFSLEIFKPGRSELSFLSKADKLDNQLYLFLLELNLLSRVKFSLEVFLSVWCSESDRLLSTKKAYTTDRSELRTRWSSSDMVVIKPVEANLKQDGTPWILHLFDELVQHWIKFNQTQSLYKGKAKKEEMPAQRIIRPFQLDIFGKCPENLTKQGTIPNILNFTLQSSIRLLGVENETQKEVSLFLVCAKCFEMWKKYDLPRESLDSIEWIFNKDIC